jgi:hypothetical protein
VLGAQRSTFRVDGRARSVGHRVHRARFVVQGLGSEEYTLGAAEEPPPRTLPTSLLSSIAPGPPSSPWCELSPTTPTCRGPLMGCNPPPPPHLPPPPPSPEGGRGGRGETGVAGGVGGGEGGGGPPRSRGVSRASVGKETFNITCTKASDTSSCRGAVCLRADRWSRVPAPFICHTSPASVPWAPTAPSSRGTRRGGRNTLTRTSAQEARSSIFRKRRFFPWKQRRAARGGRRRASEREPSVSERREN